jgi:hypothetical protein
MALQGKSFVLNQEELEMDKEADRIWGPATS